jgi:L-ribulose-5-phosphate 4-epimerase
MIDILKEKVWQANLTLYNEQLVSLTWGNVSGVDRNNQRLVIKPSGVAFPHLKMDDMVVLDLQGNVVEGSLRPSSDLPTHLELYQHFPSVGAISHTHSEFACMFAQACREIPCLGTTHADHFNGPVPVTRFLTREEVAGDYEKNTGRLIAERFLSLDYQSMPGVLVAGHGPFTWGVDAQEAVENAIILEKAAKMAWGTLLLNGEQKPLPDYLLNKHHQRKHGKNAYYGQKKKRS